MGVLSNLKADLELSATELLDEYKDRLMAEALGLCRDKAEAEDLVMRTFEVYFFKREQYDPMRGSLLTWLRAVMRNLQTDSLRRRKVSEVVMTPNEIERVIDAQLPADLPGDAEKAAEDERLVTEAVNALSPKLREAVVLHYFESLSVAEVARTLRVTENSIKNRLFYARKVLAKRLRKTVGKRGVVAAFIALLALVSAAAVTTLPVFAPVRETIAGWFGSATAGTSEAAVTVDALSSLETGAAQGNVSAAPVVSVDSAAPSTPIKQQTQEKPTMKLTSTLAAAALAATVSLTAPAGDWYVDSTRGDDGAAGTQAAPFATIKHALESAGEGDTICLADGTYSEYGLAVGNGITITSVSQDATAVTVDGQKKGKVFTLSGGATLSRITIQNGNATDSTRDDGANITVGGGSRVLACRVLNGVSGRNWDQAGGIFLASGLVENCLIKGNQAAYGGGLYVHATGACRVINCTLVENIGTNDGGQPSAAIFIERNSGGSINLWNTVCFNSKSSSDYAYGSRKDIFMRTGTFHNCAAVSIVTQDGASTAGCTTIGQDAAHFDANYVPLASSVLFDGGDEPEISGYTWPVTDLAGMTRVQGEKVDIGCYETNADALVAANPRYAAEGWTNNTPCTLSVDVLGGKAPYSFAWDFKDGTTEQTSEPTVPHVFPAGAYSPKVTVTDANGTTAVCEEWPVLRFYAAAPMYVDASCASPLAPYTNRLHAATTLDEALLMTCAPETGFNPIHDNVTIYVAEGTYDAANVQSPSKSRIHLNKAIRIVGTADDPSKVVIRNKDKKQGWRVFWLEHPDAVLANVTVSGGSFKDNSGTANAGGGVRLVDGTITNCLLTGSFNAHSNGGGPAYGGNLYQCGGLVVDSTITAGGSTREGYSDLCGGNVCLNGGRMTRCRITDGIGCPWNGSDNYGNNVFAMAGRMDSCLVSGGQNGEYSVYVQGTAELVNCTIANNKSAYTTVANHSGVFVSGDTAKLVNCLFYQNGNSSSAVNNWGSANGMAFSNCAAQTEITDGTNCQLVTAEQLADTATCVPKTRREAKAVGIVSTLVDKGALVPKINGSYGLDLIGNPRRVGNNLDIGCYEVDGVGGLLICIGSCRMISTH